VTRIPVAKVGTKPRKSPLSLFFSLLWPHSQWTLATPGGGNEAPKSLCSLLSKCPCPHITHVTKYTCTQVSTAHWDFGSSFPRTPVSHKM
jgi:hypothetical protein